MFRRLFLVFADKELRIKLFKIIGLLILVRLLAHVPIPILRVQEISTLLDSDQVFGLLNTISGGSYGRLSFIMLGVGPFITASIVMQLLGVIIPKIREIQREEGQAGQQKVNRWTRYLAVPLAALNAWGILQFLSFGDGGSGGSIDLPSVLTNNELTAEGVWAWFVVICSMTAGSMIMMWIGEIITEFKMGNGISLLILSGIVVRIPEQLGVFWNSFWPNLQELFQQFEFTKVTDIEVWKALAWTNNTWLPVRTGILFFFIFLVTLGLVIFVNDAVRRLIVIYSRRGHTEGKSRTLKNVKADLPIKVNVAGVLPIIFAVSFILFPTIVARFFQTTNIENLANRAVQVEQYLSTEPSTSFAIQPQPLANRYLGFFASQNALEIKNSSELDPTEGEDLFGFTISTFKEGKEIETEKELELSQSDLEEQAKNDLKNVFLEGTPLRFEFDSFNPGFLPEFGIHFNGVLAYTFFYFILIVFFTFFYTATVAFKTDEVSENLQKSGAYIPGYRPGQETANYLSYISTRLNVAGSIFLAIIAVTPLILNNYIVIGDGTLTGIVGGTTLLILVSVTIETLKQIEAQATAVDYDRFTKY